MINVLVARQRHHTGRWPRQQGEVVAPAPASGDGAAAFHRMLAYQNSALRCSDVTIVLDAAGGAEGGGITCGASVRRRSADGSSIRPTRGARRPLHEWRAGL